MKDFFKKIDLKRSVIVPGLLLFVILLLLNSISTSRFFRIDLTDNNMFSLSTSSKSVIKEIDDCKHEHKPIVVIKSTVPPGTTDRLHKKYKNIVIRKRKPRL